MGRECSNQANLYATSGEELDQGLDQRKVLSVVQFAGTLGLLQVLLLLAEGSPRTFSIFQRNRNGPSSKALRLGFYLFEVLFGDQAVHPVLSKGEP